jgi:hypothetical protein
VKHRHRIVSHVQIDFCKGCGYIAVHPWDAASPLDTNGLVQIGNESSAQRLRTVLSLNTDCFTKYDGCRSVAGLLPTVWKQTSEMKIACTLQNDRGFVQKPTNWHLWARRCGGKETLDPPHRSTSAPRRKPAGQSLPLS